MKKIIKRILVVFLVIVMVIGGLPITGFVRLMFPNIFFSNFIASAAYENTYINTGNQREDIIGVAKTQIGYKEGNNNDTKYGDWYGLPNQPWCAMFISWCARQANISNDVLKNSAVAAPDSNYFNIPYYNGTSYTPQKGDLFFTKSWSHVGLVYYVDGNYFYTIEGNSNNSGSSNGDGVYSLRRKISDYYFGVPNYKSQHTHNFWLQNEGAHPHNEYSKCWECGEWSYTGNTKYTDSCDICFALNYVDVWVSQGADINDPELSEGLVREYYYIWYKIANKETGALYDSYGSLDYNTKISIYYPDGTECYSCDEYSNDNNWITTPLNQAGTYRINITVDGEFTANYDEYFTVRSNGIIKFTPQTLDLDLKNKKTGSIELQIEGSFPVGAKAYLDVSNDNISYTSSGSGTITVTALKPGKSELRANAYDSYGTFLCTATAIINIKDPQYTLSYNVNGGSGGPASQTGGISYTVSSLIPQKTGYNFVGWSTNSSATAVNYYPGDKITLNTDMTLYAVWKAAESVYANSDFDVSINYSEQEILYKFMPSTSGTYVIYSTADKDTKVTLYDSTGNVILTDDNSGEGTNFRLMQNLTVKTTYYFGIKYSNSSDTGTIPVSMGKAYSISYDFNGGNGNIQKQIKDYGKDITLSTTVPTRNGYTFKGWSTKNTSSTVDYVSGAIYTLNSGLTLYAVWQPNVYMVTFNANGGSCDTSSKNVTYASTYGTLPTPTRSGYIFNGWYTAPNGGTKVTSTTSVSITQKQTLYAQWTETVLSSISVKTNPSVVNYYVGDTLNTSGLVLTAKYSDGTTKTISSGFTCTPTKLDTAGSQKITVSYGGKTTSFNVIVSSVKITELEIVTVPQKISYTVGDKFDPTGLTMNAVNTKGETIVVTDGFECTPEILDKAGTQVVTVSYGGKSVMITVVVAETEPDTYTVKFTVDGEIIEAASYEVGESIVKPMAPYKEGYKFICWAPNVPETMPANDLIFTAVFEKIPEISQTVATIRTPSTTTINYGDGIWLHAEISGELPADARIIWTPSNNNFEIAEVSADGLSCRITPVSSGTTTFTVSVVDADENVLSTDTQDMTAKAGLWQKIVAFFKKLFGTTKTYPDFLKKVF